MKIEGSRVPAEKVLGILEDLCRRSGMRGCRPEGPISLRRELFKTKKKWRSLSGEEFL